MSTHHLHTQHQRTFEGNRFVYPVLSRRSKGISVGVNLNPDKICNFDCIYCQVDRRTESEVRFVESDRYFHELEEMLDLCASGEIFRTAKFAETPQHLRRVNDIAFSGDGEPTTYKNFDDLIERSAEIKRKHGLNDVKMVLITNATMFHRPHVQRGLEILDANQGEIWAKLDAGTESYYRTIERTKIPFQRVLDNLLLAAKVRPIVIQSMFLKLWGESPKPEEITAFCDRLNEIVDGGGQIKLVQVYTVARKPAESIVTPLEDVEVDAIAQAVRERTGLSAEVYYGSSDY
ncbi:radical SAM protein [Blastopirellula marina]|uniref:Radical SAM protein n=1 Tax=Blastopirellula marina TaxID=124 RepID=A0A2S8FGI8_9BACT|nr:MULTISPECIES: radical SAM protein [Pirellulaceae]PQO31263.1 radical SAM protein [Blastopirellula marina]RCS51657.1 radical SAM protein [Bremerella cremea]